MKRIAVNTRMLLKNKMEGIGRFTYEVTKRIVENNPSVEFHFLFDRPFDEQFIFAKNVVPHVIFPQARHPFLWYWWFEWSIPYALKKIQPEAFLSADGYLSLSTNVPTHLTIHDLAFEHFPDAVPFWVKHYYKYYVPKFANSAKQIATVSEFSKQDIISQYKIEHTKIDVVYNAASGYFGPATAIEKAKTIEEITKGNPYFICVSSIHPRKNIVNLIKAFELFKQNDTQNVKLVLVGDFMFGKNEVLDVLSQMQFADSVIRTGNLPHHQIGKLQAAATATLYVSLFEGFGIPIIESMQSGVPVITSNVSSMPEVADNAALLVNPNSTEEISQAMQKVISDEQLQNILIAKGLVRSKYFSWDKTAELYWQSVERLF